MTLTEKLDFLLKEKGLSRREFSIASDIPYMTVVNFYEKGTENIKLSTLKKIASFFNVTLDYIADDSIEEIQKKDINNDELSESETELLEIYRTLNDTGQKKALERLEELSFINIYKKMKEEENTGDTVTIKYVASGGDGVGIEKISKDNYEKLLKELEKLKKKY